MKITYREENGCFYPNLELPKQTNYTIGKYGLLHLDYIKEHRKGRYTTLVSECRLSEYLHMDGEEFERFCARLLMNSSYEDVSLTKGSGDQGVDIIAYRDGIKYGIQCKCYSSDIGNAAVQEVFAGKTFYKCNVGIVLTNQHFSPSAIQLAEANGIVLWGREFLLKLIKKSQ